MSKILAEIASVVTDIERMEYDDKDPMRYAKRCARQLASDILADAASRARRALEVAELIDHDFNKSQEAAS